MTKKLIKSIGIIALGVFTIFLSSCSNMPKNLGGIPREAHVVSAIDIFSLFKKGKLNEISNLKSFNRLNDEMDYDTKRFSDVVNLILKDPKATGIDFQSDLFIYYLENPRDEKFVGFTLALKDQEKFTAFSENAFDHLKIKLDIKKDKSFNYALVGNEMAIGWDKNKAIVLVAAVYESKENLGSEMETLMDLNNEDQITTNQEFTKFYENKKDVSVWFSSNLLKDKLEFKQLEEKFKLDLSDNYVSSYLTFGNNNISLKTNFSLNKNLQKMIEENNALDNSFDNKLLNYLPETSFIALSLSVNPMSYYSIMEKQDNFEKIRTGFNKKTGVELKDLFESIKGNAIFSLYEYKEVNYTYQKYEGSYDEDGNYNYDLVEKEDKQSLPIMGLAFDINENIQLKTILDSLSKEIINTDKGYYEFKFENKFPAYLALDEHVFFITNDKERVKLFKDNGHVSDNLNSSFIGSKITESNFYTYIDLDYENYPEEIKGIFKKIQSKRDVKIFSVWNSLAKSFEIKNEEENTIEIILNTQENNSNSLDFIISTLDNNYKELVPL